MPADDVTFADAVSVTSNEPPERATLARVGTAPDARQGCRSVTAPEHESIASLLRQIASPLLAGRVFTASKASGSRFEIRCTVDELHSPRYERSPRGRLPLSDQYPRRQHQ